MGARAAFKSRQQCAGEWCLCLLLVFMSACYREDLAGLKSVFSRSRSSYYVLTMLCFMLQGLNTDSAELFCLSLTSLDLHLNRSCSQRTFCFT